jgi:hypothetical protein
LDVKDIRLQFINSKVANDFVREYHYSGKIVANSCLHFGVFYKEKLHGVLSYGSSMRKDLIKSLVKDTGWNDFLELNRMAFDDFLPKNSESRGISISIKMIKKQYPHIKWIISFADGTQCGDGAIYRASGFVLTGIKKNTQIRVNPETGKPMQSMAAFHAKKSNDFKNWKALEGNQLRYIYFIDKAYKEKLTVPILPFSKIKEMGAGMYKGVKTCPDSVNSNTSSFQDENGGATPTSGLLYTKNASES